MLDFKNHTMITDLYQLTMMAVYNKHKINTEATFEMFFRRLPKNRSYLIFAGLENIIEYVNNLKFTNEDINYIKTHPAFTKIDNTFFEYLRNFEFQCDVKAFEEGELIFPNEPVLQVTGPLIQAQLIETYILSMLNFQTMIATKASRVKYVSGKRLVLEFGARRAHSPYASVLGSRASYIGGIDGTSNVKAGMLYGINASGTIAHSYIMSFDSEQEAFDKYLDVFPENSILLVDTYDTIEAIKKITKYKKLNKKIYGIRIDSGDLLSLTKKVRSILDDAGMESTKIIISSDLNEYIIKELLDKNAPVDGFGVGTELITSKDDPAMSGVYKLVDIIENGKHIPKSKFSAEKQSYPGKKEVFRFEKNGKFEKDIVALHDEVYEGRKLLKSIYEKGKLVYDIPNIEDVRNKAKNSLEKLEDNIINIDKQKEYKIEISKRLQDMQKQIKDKQL